MCDFFSFLGSHELEDKWLDFKTVRSWTTDITGSTKRSKSWCQIKVSNTFTKIFTVRAIFVEK